MPDTASRPNVRFGWRVQRVAATLQSLRKDGVFRMGYRGRIYFTEKQKAEIWDRWQRGESMRSIGRRFDRNSSSIYPLLARTGGIRPSERRRSRLALTVAEREEISRGLRARLSFCAIARQLRRAPSTISREVRPGSGLSARSPASSLVARRSAGQYRLSLSASGRRSRSRAG